MENHLLPAEQTQEDHVLPALQPNKAHHFPDLFHLTYFYLSPYNKIIKAC